MMDYSRDSRPISSPSRQVDGSFNSLFERSHTTNREGSFGTQMRITTDPNYVQKDNLRTSTGIDALNPNRDMIFQSAPKISPSPIGERVDNRLSPSQWDAFATLSPPQHMDNLFGPSPFKGLRPQEIEVDSDPDQFPFDEGLTSPRRPLEDEVFSFDPLESTFSRGLGTDMASSMSNLSLHSPSMGMSPGSFTLSSSMAFSPSESSLGDANGANLDQFNNSYGEHPQGEHPSRTLFVRNINSNVEDEELTMLFEQYGPIRSMYTQCKHRGFVMISYYDIRHAKNAMRHLQSKPLRRRKLDIHYSIPKENPSEKDQNQGTLVVFNLDPSTTNDELKHIFEHYGEIKEVRETPNKKHHKFIEFYDVRDADKAMKALNKSDIRGKKIKIEPSRPGGVRKGNTNGSVMPGIHSNGSSSSFHEDDLSLSYNSPEDHTSLFTPLSPLNSMPLNNPLSPTYSFMAHSFNTPPHSQSQSVNNTLSLSHSLNSLSNGVQGVSGHTLASSQSTSFGVSSGSPSALSHSLGRGVDWGINGGMGSSPGMSPVATGWTEKAKTGEDKTRFKLYLHRVGSEDNRTTLMIKNIPNKYNQKMLLAAVDDKHRGSYDFFYLPIDFKNKCNVGYAFINFIGYDFIRSFYEEFNNKRWEKFNSEKVCNITYARIQGKNALIQHFQNSSLMCEDKKCRPIIFHSIGPNIGEQEPFPVGPNLRRRNSDSPTWISEEGEEEP
eukprot:TRINITY_DN4235_c0_g1_i4.p1 TRINITY_DN4235_c0_g1~~TRINITY_DN4235_c0_g1_i4.p1  ORF type:complete len:720 (+),score=121.49 TRINITY_DN4235_c0_g1_i4:327-2486(+)